MSASFLDNAIRAFPTRKHVLVADAVPFINAMKVPGEDGYDVYVHKASDITEVSADCLVNVQPSTTIPASTNNAIIDFRLTQGIVDRWDHSYLKLTFTNNTGAPCTLVAAPLLLNYTQIFASNGNTLLMQAFGIESWLTVCQMTTFQDWNIMQKLVGSDANYNPANVVIANGASRNLYIPLISLFISSRLFLSGIKDTLLVRFTFNPSNLQLVAGALPTLSQATFLLRGAYDAPQVRDLKMRLYRTMPLDFLYIGMQRSSYPLTLAANTSYNIQIQGVVGLICFAFIAVRAVPITAANQATPLPYISTFDITDVNGSSLIGYYQRDVADVTNFASDQQLMSLEYFDNNFSLNSNFYLVSWSRSPQSDFSTGSSHGFCPFDGFCQLKFTTTAGTVPGAYQIEFWARDYQTLKCRGGVLTSSRGS